MASRPRRANAGANMKKLMTEAEEEDEFYKDKYGGFMDVEDDSDFAQSEISDDVVDSDFDLSENEPEQDDEANEREIRQEERASRKKAQTYKDPKVHKPPVRRKKMSDVNNLPKKPRISAADSKSNASKLPSTKYSRTLRQSTHQMTFDRIERENRARRKKQRQRKHYRDGEDAVKLTQEELMAEAKITEVENTLWLEKFKNLEVEKTKKRPKRDFKESKDFTIQQFGYLEHSKDSETGEEKSIIRSVISFPSDETMEKYFPKPDNLPEIPDPKVCWVTGLPAKYKDPITGLPYYNIQAYQVIRKVYYRYLEKSPQFRDNERVREYLNNVTDSSEPIKIFNFSTEPKPKPRYETLQDLPVQLNINPNRNRTVNLGVNSSSVLSPHVQQTGSVLGPNPAVHQVQLTASPGLTSLSSSNSASLSANTQVARPPFTVQQTSFASPQKPQQNILQIQQNSGSTPATNQQNILQQPTQQTTILQSQNILQKPTQIGQQTILQTQQQQQQQTSQQQQQQHAQNILPTTPKQTIQLQATQQPIQTVQIQGQPQIQTIQIQQSQQQSGQIQLQTQAQTNQQQATQQIPIQSQPQQSPQTQPMKMYITAVANNDNAYIIPRASQDPSTNFVIQNPPPSQ